MPENGKILLDRCVVKSNDKPQSNDYNVTYDFFLLEPTGMFRKEKISRLCVGVHLLNQTILLIRTCTLSV